MAIDIRQIIEGQQRAEYRSGADREYQRQAAIQHALAQGYLKHHENHAAFTLGNSPIEQPKKEKNWTDFGWDTISNLWDESEPIGLILGLTSWIASLVILFVLGFDLKANIDKYVGVFFFILPIDFWNNLGNNYSAGIYLPSFK